MKKKVVGVLAGSCLAFSMVGMASGSIVVNGGFEQPGSGTVPSDWTLNPDPNAVAAGAYNGLITNGTNPPPTGPVNSGSFAEELQALNSPTNSSPPGEDSNIFEITPQVGGDTVDPADGPYTLSYYLQGTLGVSGVLFVQAQWATAAGPIGGGGGFTFNSSLPSSYTLETLALGTPPSNATGVDVEFSAETGAVQGGSVTAFIDDVSVTGSAVPEPASLGILGLGAYGLLMRRRSPRES